MALPTTIITSCRKGIKNEVQKYLQKNGKKAVGHVSLESGQTLLHIASEAAQEEIVNLILSEKYKNQLDINGIDKKGWTPLHSACQSGNLAIIDHLLKRGAFVRALTNENASPLHYFVMNEHNEQNSEKFHGILAYIVKKGGLIDFQNIRGETASHYAAICGRFRTLQILIQLFADLSLTTSKQETILLYAMRGGNEECAKLLLDSGADPTIEPTTGELFKAAMKYQTPKIRNLIRAYYLTHQMSVPDYMGEFEQNATPPRLSASGGLSIPTSNFTFDVSFKDPLVSEKHERRKRFSKSMTIPKSPGDDDVPSKKTIRNFDHYSDGHLRSLTSLIHPSKTEMTTRTKDHNNNNINSNRSGVHSKEKEEETSARNKSDEKKYSGDSASKAHYYLSLFNLFKSSKNSTQNNYHYHYINNNINNKNNNNNNNNNDKNNNKYNSINNINNINKPSSVNNNYNNNRIRENRNSFHELTKELKENKIRKHAKRSSAGDINNNDQIDQNHLRNLRQHLHLDLRNSAENSVSPTSPKHNHSDNNLHSSIKSNPEKKYQNNSDNNLNYSLKNYQIHSDDLPGGENNSTVCIPHLASYNNHSDGWKCRSCATICERFPLMLFCEAPQSFVDISDDIKATKVRLSSDLCVIDNSKFFVRCILEIPILHLHRSSQPDDIDANDSTNNTDSTKEGKSKCGCKLSFGVWAGVSQRDFLQLIDRWHDDEEMKYKGKLNNSIFTIYNCLDLPVTITTRKKLRPIIAIDRKDHPIARAQREGISLKCTEELLMHILC